VPGAVFGTAARIARVRVKLVVAGVAAALAAASCAAAAPPRDYSTCLQKAQTTFAIDQCAGAEYRRVDALLNAEYRRVAAAVGPANRPALAAAERAWIAFRDRDCALAAAHYRGGTLAPVAQTMCVVDRETTRLQELKAMLADFTQGQGSTKHR
jgi:uncharacterized protein YecT (DUF1311 family)